MHEDVLRPWVEVRPERHAPIRECRRDGAPLLLLLHFVLILTFHPEPPWQCSVARGEGGPRRGEPVGARGAEDKSAQRERHELERAREQHEARRCELWPCEVAGERLPQLSRGALQTNIAKARRVEPQQIEPEADTQIGGCGAQNVVSALQGAQDDEQASKACRVSATTRDECEHAHKQRARGQARGPLCERNGRFGPACQCCGRAVSMPRSQRSIQPWQ
mmetsp:Transcript_13559/g.41183  ORF Transcript_13559/g.41183 Transcript_13559/m.41183 type:complete len:220 (+) Transcript_13559:1819-2478(+)